MKNNSSFTCKLHVSEAERLLQTLQAMLFAAETPPAYALWKMRGDDTLLIFYASGKLVVQGKGVEQFRTAVLTPLFPNVQCVMPQESTPPCAQNDVPFTAHAGMDESGKGDFFGPLVVCSAFVDPEQCQALLQAGVKDCKLLRDDQVLPMAAAAQKILSSQNFAVLVLKNATYNRLYASMGNLNTLLAWAHATALENLLEKQPACTRALLDQFANPALIRSKLKTRGRSIVFEQHTKAESDPAVAVASVIARAAFLRTMQALREETGLDFPKGCSTPVMAFCRKLAHERRPLAFYENCCKTHFKTFQELNVPLA